MGLGERPSKRLDNRHDRFGILLEDGELGVVPTHLAAEGWNVGQAGVIPVWIENNDGVMLGGKLLNYPASCPALAGTSHGEDRQMACHNRVAVNFDIDLGSVGE